MEAKDVIVGIGDLNVVFPPNKLITIGLGSCVGIALYDGFNKVAGLAHIMLPISTEFTGDIKPMKFADKAIPMLIEKMQICGADQRRISARIAGGAKMFAFDDSSPIMEIGKRNIQAVKAVLKELNIPIGAEDLGGNVGRTMILEAQTGKLTIKTVGKGTSEL
jgi:chemotaxis protein CheD